MTTLADFPRVEGKTYAQFYEDVLEWYKEFARTLRDLRPPEETTIRLVGHGYTLYLKGFNDCKEAVVGASSE